MLSPLFWLSLVAVFWGVKWLAEGLMSLGDVEIRRAEPVVAEVVHATEWAEPAPAESLDRAA